jgi:hypothetical protein
LVKPDDAKEILAAFGMPTEQQNPNAVYTLLAFANIGPRTPWSKASNPRRTPHDVIAFARDNYQKIYAENTRETIRRQAIHQFVQGGLLARNPDDPNLATNSPRTHYALTPEALEVIRSFGAKGFDATVRRFLTAQKGGSLLWATTFQVGTSIQAGPRVGRYIPQIRPMVASPSS